VDPFVQKLASKLEMKSSTKVPHWAVALRASCVFSQQPVHIYPIEVWT